ncbi:MAG: hypothetical protein IPK14_22045 [Blastocatellia bacterium]|nr:hypothetical protein [Blastocatellia bacterium]MBL8192870.1 hypothetical protein [Blastocatellia bacterium]MBN8722024.1 hypothetical protein [Acidobacteriota bacterium]
MLDRKELFAGRQLTMLDSLSQKSSFQAVSVASKKLNLNIKAQDAKVYFLSIKDIKDQLNFTDTIAVAVSTEIKGQLPATSLLLISKDNALNIIASTIGAKSDRPISFFSFTPQMVLKILAESFATSFAKNLSLTFPGEADSLVSTPEVFFDNWSKNLETVFSRACSNINDYYVVFTLIFNTIINNNNCQGFQLYLLDRSVLQSLVRE